MQRGEVEYILRSMVPYLNNLQMKKLKVILDDFMEGNSKQISNEELLDRYFSAKRAEGCSEKSINYYQATISKALSVINVNALEIVTDQLRQYLMDYQEQNGSSKVTIDNIRRILSSFFNWLEDEDYIVKSPIRRIHKVRIAKTVKETYTDEEQEALRDSCSNIRDLALLDLLSSTGMRVGELVLLNRQDIDFNERECVVLGKGSKERITYFDARTKIHLKQYLESRLDSNEALFVGIRKPNKRLTISGVEGLLKRLGDRVGISKVYPHKFRRTLATKAIDKGMPIEQLQRLLGHSRIDTTLHYAMVKQQNVKNAHRKYIG